MVLEFFGVWGWYVELGHNHVFELCLENWDWEFLDLVVDAKCMCGILLVSFLST